MAVVVSQGQTIEDLKAKGLDIEPHRQRLLKGKLDEKFKNPEDDLRLVFVCAMWITGFDVPTCSTIYLDKPMRAHAFTNVNDRKGQPRSARQRVRPDRRLRRHLQSLAECTRYLRAAGQRWSVPMFEKTKLVEALDAALKEVAGFANARGVALDAIAAAQGFERIGLIDDAVEAFLATEAEKKSFLQMAGRVARLFKAILPDSAANELAPLAVLVTYLAAKIRAETEPPRTFRP